MTINEKSIPTYNYITSLICGFLFGAGLVLSEMTLPEKVIHFLQMGEGWDPSLIFVFMGALMVSIPGFWWMKATYHPKHANISEARKPFFDTKLNITQNKVIDKNLIIGAIIFGVGWALGGYCPGPGIVSATAGQKPAIIFTISMLIGMILHHFYLQWFEKMMTKWMEEKRKRNSLLNEHK
jgi:uncharacterized membrane protein YedE/YeeE